MGFKDLPYHPLHLDFVRNRFPFKSHEDSKVLARFSLNWSPSLGFLSLFLVFRPVVSANYFFPALLKLFGLLLATCVLLHSPLLCLLLSYFFLPCQFLGGLKYCSLRRLLFGVFYNPRDRALHNPEDLLYCYLKPKACLLLNLSKLLTDFRCKGLQNRLRFCRLLLVFFKKTPKNLLMLAS